MTENLNKELRERLTQRNALLVPGAPKIAGWDERQRIVGRHVFEELDNRYMSREGF
jgi:hypothetical protein